MKSPERDGSLTSCDIVLLGLANGRATNIDLSPLAACRNLELISLAMQPLGSVDLSPLWACPNVDLSDLKGNPLGDVDTGPVTDEDDRDE